MPHSLTHPPSLPPTGDDADEPFLCSEQAEAQAELGAAAAALLCRVLKALALRAHADALRLARLVCARCIGAGVAEAEDVRRALQLGLQAVLTDEPPSEVRTRRTASHMRRAVCLGSARSAELAAEGRQQAALLGVAGQVVCGCRRAGSSSPEPEEKDLGEAPARPACGCRRPLRLEGRAVHDIRRRCHG